MLGVGLGVRLLAAAAPAPAPAPPFPAPPGKSSFPLSSSLRRRSSSWWVSNGNGHERDGTTATTSSRAARRKWWSDPEDNQQDYGNYESSSLEEEDGGDYGDEDEDAFSGLGGAGGLFDEPWFSKVYKTSGFLLPVVLVSMLAATGPKAFLMAMAIPLGQSAVSFVIDAVWGRRRRNRDRDDRWRRPFQEEEEEDYAEDTANFGARGRDNGYGGSSNFYKGRREHSYESWVSNDFADTASAGGGTDDNNTKSSSSGDGGGNRSNGGFGGWDDLLDNDTAAAQDETRSTSFSAGKTDYSKRSQPSATREEDVDAAAAGSGGRTGQGVGVPRTRVRTRRQRTPRTMGLGTTRYKQAPLLMRLLVAVFPFMGSWFRLL